MKGFFANLGLATNGHYRKLAFEEEREHMRNVAKLLEQTPATVGKAQELVVMTQAGGFHPGRLQALTKLVKEPRFLDAFTPDERTGVEAFVRSASDGKPVEAPSLNVPGSYRFYGTEHSVERTFELEADGKTWRPIEEHRSEKGAEHQFEMRVFRNEQMKWVMYRGAGLPLERQAAGLWHGYQGDAQNGRTFNFTVHEGAPPTLESRSIRTHITHSSRREPVDFTGAPPSGPFSPGARMKTIESTFVPDARRGAQFVAWTPHEPKKYGPNTHG